MDKNAENPHHELAIRILDSWPMEKWSRFRRVLAVSGGADSVALFRLFVYLEGGARRKEGDDGEGEESREDARFVAELAGRYQIPFVVESIDPDELRRETEREGSLEAAARNLRYRLLLENAGRFGARFILTAHHADDQIETLLHRFFRGSGIDGLAGMTRFRPLNEAVVLVRPLLDFRRSEILDYLGRLGQAWRTDSSNESPDFLRNRIRNELIPLLTDLFPNRFEKSLLQWSGTCRELSRFLQDSLDRYLADYFDRKGGGKTRFEEGAFSGIVGEGGERGTCPPSFPLDLFREMPETLAREFFRRLWRDSNWPLGEMSQEKWRLLATMGREGTPSAVEFPGGIVVRVIKDRLEIVPSTQNKRP